MPSTRRAFISEAAIATAMAALGAPLVGADAAARRTLQTYKIPRTDLVVSRIAYGCANLWKKELTSSEALATAERLVKTAYDLGITFFDHADVYGEGNAEILFGKVLKRSPGMREKIVLQSKCGVSTYRDVPFGRAPVADLSRSHIIQAAEGSLKRLNTERLDILLLHWPDALVRPEEVAEAFTQLKRSGKVRYFGVSNHTPAQIELLKTTVSEPLVANQVRLGLTHCYLIADTLERRAGITGGSTGSVTAAETLDYCRRNGMQVQAWSPLRGDLFSAPPGAANEIKLLVQAVADMAEKKNTNRSAIALAWLLRHPAQIVPIVGSTKVEHIVENVEADRVTLDHREWYTLYNLASRLPPQPGWVPE